MAQALHRRPSRRSITHLRLLTDPMLPIDPSPEEFQIQSSRWSLSTNGTPLNGRFPNNLSGAEPSRIGTASTSSLHQTRRTTLFADKSKINVLTKSRPNHTPPPLPDPNPVLHSTEFSDFLDLSDGRGRIRKSSYTKHRSRRTVLDSESEESKARWRRSRKPFGRIISYPSRVISRVFSRNSTVPGLPVHPSTRPSTEGDTGSDKALPEVPTNKSAMPKRKRSGAQYRRVAKDSWEVKDDDDRNNPPFPATTEVRPRSDSLSASNEGLKPASSVRKAPRRRSRSLSELKRNHQPSTAIEIKEARDDLIDTQFDSILEFYSSDPPLVLVPKSPQTRANSMVRSPIKGLFQRGKNRPFPVTTGDDGAAKISSGSVVSSPRSPTSGT